MRTRGFGMPGLYAALACVAALVIGGLAWVTVASLRVEEAQLEATVRADRANKERLALWRLDSQLLPTLGLENNRPYSHYSALHTPYPAVDTEQDVFAPGNLRLPSPLLSCDVPAWQVLHFQIDPETGWQSPQVLTPELTDRLRGAPFHLAIDNVGPERTEKLADLRARFPAADVLRTLAEAAQASSDDSPFYVPVPFLDETAVPKPGYQPGDAEPSEARPMSGATAVTRSLGKERLQRTATMTSGRGGAPEGALAQKAMPPGPGGFGGGSGPRPPAPVGAPGAAPTVVAEPVAAEALYPPAAAGYNRAGNSLGLTNPAPATPAPASIPVAPTTGPNPPPAVANSAPTQQLTTGNQLKLPYGFPRGAPPANDQVNDIYKEAKEFEARMRATQKSQDVRGGYDNSAKNAVQQQVGNASQLPAGPQALPNAEKANDVPQSRFAANAPASGAAAVPPENDPKYRDLKRESQTEFRKGAVKKMPEDAAKAKGVESDEKEALRKLAEDKKKPGERLEAFVNDPPGKKEDPARRFKAEEQAKSSEGKDDAKKLDDNVDRLAARDRMTLDRASGAFAPPGAKKSGPVVQPVAVHLGPMRPHWLAAADGSEILVLVRVARLETRTVYQGVVLDWPLLRDMLREQVAELFPHATLTPVHTVAELSPERAMTALPVQLDPGPPPEPPAIGWTPLRFGLALAWATSLLALLAVGFGGRALVSLSERRIRFVSAVTHELRTPMTSLRLYLDLLNSGLIDDEAKKKEYLMTLANESDRLHRLVENVLDFARLEKRSVMATLQPTEITAILDELRVTWSDRCAADAMEFVVISTLPPDQRVTTDLRMAAQVLGNLVDNARKYAREADDKRIWLWAKPGERGRVCLEVEDRGPGVAAGERGTIFRAFRRGKDADTIAGGAGLGLALARQWAEIIGGRLSYRPADGGVGACFRLELPAART